MQQQPNKPNKKQALSEYAKYSSLVFQMAITIGVGAWGGTQLDDYFNIYPALTLVLTFSSIGIAFYIFFKSVLKK